MFPTADSEDISQVTSLRRNSSPPRNERDSHELSQVSKQKKDFTVNMLIKELIFCVALALTTYGALHNTPTKISTHPPAVRFFSPHSVVTDWYRGQLTHALSYITNVDVSFVMYYAPWDAESQYVRDEFEKAATILHDRVHFAAINCWNPGSECRLQHSKIPSWPILMAYTITTRGILYKGPRDAHSMVKFLELIMKPLERISSTEDLVHLLSICDAVAVGYTPLSDTTKFYNIWYQVSIKSKEFDVIGEVCFAAVTSEELASDLGVDSVPSARLMLWNSTKEYNINEESDRSWNETSLIMWVLDNFTQPVARIMPLWRKAFSFERFVDGNPILMLFTPLNPLYQQLPSYDLLREIAMEYYNCKNNETKQWTKELMKLQQVQRLIYEQRDLDKYCQDYKFKSPQKTNKYIKKAVVSHNNKYPWSNTTQKNQKNGFFNYLLKRGLAISKLIENSDNSDVLASLGLMQCSAVLPAEKSYYENPQKCLAFEEDVQSDNEMEKDSINSETTMLPLEGDILAPENLVQENAKHFCKLLKFAKEFSPIIKPERVNNVNLTSVEGLACAKNFTLNMVAVDSVQNHHFAESLGINIARKKDMTALVILDSKHESQYVLSEPYNAKSVREFISNFTRQTLSRSLRTHVPNAAHTHYFGSGKEDQRADTDGNTVRILDLTTKTFSRVVRTPGQLTMVVACDGACPASATRALAGAARVLAASGLSALPARLDARRHDLPAPYCPPALPALLLFSHRNGELDSLAYPASQRVSASGLVALALRALAPPPLRLRLALCARPNSNFEKKTCLKELKDHVTSAIGRNLKNWRRSMDPRLKAAFLERLQNLHKVSLHLSLLHISDLNENSNKLNTLLSSLDNLSKHWDANVSRLAMNLKTTPQKR